MPWIITDNIIDQKCDDPVVLFHSIDYNPTDPPLFDVFRMLDDDDEVYFIGVGDCLANDEFEPLDSLGLSYGCTAIEYKIDGKWVRI